MTSNSRRRLYLTLGLATLALAVGGVAQAFSTNRAEAPIQKKNSSCGADIGNKAIGEATFNRSGNTLTVKVKMTRAPNTTYYVTLYNADSCYPIKFLGKFKVSGGTGSKTGTADVTGYSSFFVDVADSVNDNDSTIVSL
jgi:peroxiredoxin family protein